MPQAAPILGNIAINLGVAWLSSVVGDLIRPKTATQTQTTSRGISFEVSVGESVPVSAIFGRGRTSGFLIFAQEYGPRNRYAKFLFVDGKGNYDGAEQLLVDEKVRACSGSNDDAHGKVVDDFTVEGTPHLWWKTYTGAPGQGADAGLIAAAPTRWTSSHKATGTPYSIITILQNPDLFGSSLPRFSRVWRGLKLYDWRYDSTMPGGDGPQRWDDQTTWAWTENPIVIRWNFRRGYWINGVKVLGMGFSRWAQDLAYYTAAANLCDELVEYPETTAEIARYAFGREIFDDEQPLDVLRELDEAVCGASFDRGGGDAPLPASQRTALITLEDKHLVRGAPIRKDRGGAVSRKKTAYHGSFVSAADAWAPRPYGMRSSTDLEELIGGRRLAPFDQPYETRIERAQARAEIALRREHFPATRTETFGPRANVLEPGDAIERVMGDWGTMLGIVETVEPGPKRMSCTITWRQWDNSIVPASGEEFVELPPDTGTAPVAADRALTVSGLSVLPYERLGAGGAIKPHGRATWTHIDDPNVERLLIVAWPVDGTEADDAETWEADPRLVDVKVFGPLPPETDMTGYATLVRKDGRSTVHTNLFAFTTGLEVAPAVADGAVTSVALNKALKDAINFVVGTGPGTVQDLQQRIADELDRLASSVVTSTMASDRDRKIVSSAVAAVQAAVVQEALSRANADSALAQFILEVAAQAASGLAEGLFTVQAVSGPAGASVTLALLARVTNLETYVETGILIALFPDGIGGYDSKIIFKAESIFFTDGANTTQPMVFEDGILTLNVANIGTVTAGLLRNPSGSSFLRLSDGAVRLSRTVP